MINHISFQGRFVKDPELKQSSNGLDYSNFSLAWSEKYGENENVCFLDCVAYRSNADIISRYFKKGDMILVEGKLFTTKFKDKNGNNKSSLHLSVEKVHFCSTSQKSEFDDDSLPF